MTSKFFVIYDGEDYVEIVKAPSAPPNTLSGPFPSYDEAVCHLWHWDYRRGGPLSGPFPSSVPFSRPSRS